MRGIIYVLIDPRTDEVRYVGQTRSDLKIRLRRHMQHSQQRDHHVHRWIRSLREAPMIAYVEVCDVEQLNERERHWITHYRRLGSDLCNLTDGGSLPPTRGRPPWNKGKRGVSDETRSRMSASAKARGGHPFPESAKRKLSDDRVRQEWVKEAGRKGARARWGGDA